MPWLVLLSWFAVTAVLALALQVLDAVVTTVESRTIRDEDDAEAVARRRLGELTWTIAVTAAAAVVIAAGVDFAGRLVDEPRTLGWGIVSLLLVALIAFGLGMIGVLAVVRRDRPTYARIRRDLRDRPQLRLDDEELAAVTARLEAADRRRARRARAGMRLRILGATMLITCASVLITAGAVTGQPTVAVLAALAVVADVAALTVAIVAVRRRSTALEAVLDAQRAEVSAMIERARIPVRAPVPGLRDRVHRALAILREQQR